MGYSLKWYVLNEREEMKKWSATFSRECVKYENRNFRGYSRVFDAILSRSEDEANAGFAAIVKGHERECRGRGVFRYTDDELLCVWGVGLANLCRSRGLSVRPVPPLIPADLLVK